MHREPSLLRVPSVIAALGVLAAPGIAAAQIACGPGQAVVDAAGHCCSPGQAWNPITNVCVEAVPTAPSAYGPPPPFGAPSPGVGGFNVIVSRPAPDPTAPVVVTFVPEQPGDLETLQLQPVGGGVTMCNLPCVVRLAPGYVSITGTGQRDFTSGFNVPAGDPIAVRVNHYDSHAFGLTMGLVVTVFGLGATVGGAIEMAGSNSDTGAGLGLGITGVTLGSIALCIGPLILIAASGGGYHPLSVMSPGEVSRSAVSLRTPGLHFAGLASTALPGGGGAMTAGFTF